MADFNDIPTGLRVPAQIPLDVKEYFSTLADLVDLGADNNKAFTYYKGFKAFCVEDDNIYIWQEADPLLGIGLLPTNFTYPNGLIVFGIDYSLKEYNFYKRSETILVENVGGGIGVFKEILVSQIETKILLKSLTSLDGSLSFDDFTDEESIDMSVNFPDPVDPPEPIEPKTYSVNNLGEGTPIYKLPNTIVGDNIEFNLKTLKPLNNSINITQDGDYIYFEVNQEWLQENICNMVSMCDIDTPIPDPDLRAVFIDWQDTHTQEARSAEFPFNAPATTPILVHLDVLVFNAPEVLLNAKWQKENASGWIDFKNYTTANETLNAEVGFLNRYRIRAVGTTGTIQVSNVLSYEAIRLDENGDPGPGCPTLDMYLNTSKSTFKLVSELEVGDLLYTKHEKTKKYGLYPISKLANGNQNVLEFTLANGMVLKVSDSHEFEEKNGNYKKASEFYVKEKLLLYDKLIEISAIKELGVLPIMKIEVEDAHTYMVSGVNSHNKILPPIDDGGPIE